MCEAASQEGALARGEVQREPIECVASHSLSLPLACFLETLVPSLDTLPCFLDTLVPSLDTLLCFLDTLPFLNTLSCFLNKLFRFLDKNHARGHQPIGESPAPLAEFVLGRGDLVLGFGLKFSGF